jgi:hypothetical protein
MRRISGDHERIERVDIVVGKMSKMVVGKCRIKMAPFAVDAVTQGTAECFFRPTANPSFCIRCNIAREDSAERRRQRSGPGIGPATRCGMANCTIADVGKLGAFDHERGIEGSRFGSFNRVDRRLPDKQPAENHDCGHNDDNRGDHPTARHLDVSVRPAGLVIF